MLPSAAARARMLARAGGEMAAAGDLKSPVRKNVKVRVLSGPCRKKPGF
jgi:hypothetical protein